jgi:hypothetical protein
MWKSACSQRPAFSTVSASLPAPRCGQGVGSDRRRSRHGRIGHCSLPPGLTFCTSATTSFAPGGRHARSHAPDPDDRRVLPVCRRRPGRDAAGTRRAAGARHSYRSEGCRHARRNGHRDRPRPGDRRRRGRAAATGCRPDLRPGHAGGPHDDHRRAGALRVQGSAGRAVRPLREQGRIRAHAIRAAPAVQRREADRAGRRPGAAGSRLQPAARGGHRRSHHRRDRRADAGGVGAHHALPLRRGATTARARRARRHGAHRRSGALPRLRAAGGRLLRERDDRGRDVLGPAIGHPLRLCADLLPRHPVGDRGAAGARAAGRREPERPLRARAGAHGRNLGHRRRLAGAAARPRVRDGAGRAGELDDVHDARWRPRQA